MFHEEQSQLSAKTKDMKRALDSLREELEAIDWYNQRADACEDGELRDILRHNAEEEKEHAAMILEWIRKHDDEFDEHLSQFLFKPNRVTENED